MLKSKTGIMALCGVKGSGKDETFRILKELAFKGPIRRVALADKLKAVCAQVFSLNPKYFNDPKLKDLILEEETVYIDREHIEELLESYDIEGTVDELGLRKHMGCKCYTPREVLQYVGSDILRSIDPDIHVRSIVDLIDDSKLTVVTDVRFENEFNYFYDNVKEFTPVYVKNVKAEEISKSDGHISETSVFKFNHKCYELRNDGSDMDKLVENVKQLVKTVYGG